MDITADLYWQHIAVITRWLDSHPALFGDALQWRIGKITEEVGEVHAALVALAGQNPRKSPVPGASRVDHLAAELADVIVTASVALLTLTPNADQHLTARLDLIRQRTSPTYQGVHS